jgi:ADP-ribose pyrophosphatase
MVYRGRAVNFCADVVRLPDGGRAVREYLDHPGAVAVVPVLGGGRNPQILFVRQYRYPVRELTYEIPAGKLAPGEKPLPCVRRELEEETGRRARRLEKLLSYWPTAAFANEIIHIYVARDLQKGRFNPDHDEFIEPAVLSLRRALSMVRSGAIKDSKTIIGLLSFASWAGK